ncbi:MAG: thioredoxin family protein [Pseudomonadota bacterium]|nr:thioredoxin family protein [Pseudomonadota bacterium]
MTDNGKPAAIAEVETSIRELTSDNFSAAIDDQSLAIVDFWAPWCAPCRAFAPVFAAAAAKHSDAFFAKVNTEEEQELAAQFGIRSIPTLMIFRDNIIVFSEAGALGAGSLEQVLTAAKALDMDAVRRSVEEQSAERESERATPAR